MEKMTKAGFMESTPKKRLIADGGRSQFLPEDAVVDSAFMDEMPKRPGLSFTVIDAVMERSSKKRLIPDGGRSQFLPEYAVVESAFKEKMLNNPGLSFTVADAVMESTPR